MRFTFHLIALLALGLGCQWAWAGNSCERLSDDAIPPRAAALSGVQILAATPATELELRSDDLVAFVRAIKQEVCQSEVVAGTSGHLLVQVRLQADVRPTYHVSSLGAVSNALVEALPDRLEAIETSAPVGQSGSFLIKMRIGQ